MSGAAAYSTVSVRPAEYAVNSGAYIDCRTAGISHIASAFAAGQMAG